MRDRSFLENFNDVLRMIENHDNFFKNQFNRYIIALDKLGVKMEISPCFFYNMKFKTRMRQKGCCMFYRIRLFPKKYSYNHARKLHLSKEIFSHKIIGFLKVSKGYKVKTYFHKDGITENFIKNIHNKAIILEKKSKPGYMALKENIFDVIRSFVLMHRYRTEVKTDFYGFDLHWMILIIAIILIILESDAYWDFLFSLGD